MKNKDKNILTAEKDLKQSAEKYLTRLSHLINIHTLETKERFLPYYIALYYYLFNEIPFEAQDTKYNDLKLCYAIVCNTLDNTWDFDNRIDGELFNLFYRIIRETGLIDYTEFMGKTPIPLQEYSKFRYDMRDRIWKSC